MRLQKYLAHAGVASRRGAEELIKQGRVRVNGALVRELGTLVDEDAQVFVDRKRVQPVTIHTYIVLHKPVGVVTTMRDPQGRRSVASLLGPDVPRVVPVGRLDYDTSGVLLLTDDGALAHVLTHPRFGVEKTYRAVVRGRLTGEQVARIRGGVRLDGARTAPARLRIIAARTTESQLDITIHEGRNRQVRRMLEAVGHPIIALTRIRFGPIALGELPVGTYRAANERELAALRRIVRDAASAAVSDERHDGDEASQ
jgi:23S rRNA pseudouridine2605 synthase